MAPGLKNHQYCDPIFLIWLQNRIPQPDFNMMLVAIQALRALHTHTYRYIDRHIHAFYCIRTYMYIYIHICTSTFKYRHTLLDVNFDATLPSELKEPPFLKGEPGQSSQGLIGKIGFRGAGSDGLYFFCLNRIFR